MTETKETVVTTPQSTVAVGSPMSSASLFPPVLTPAEWKAKAKIVRAPTRESLTYLQALSRDSRKQNNTDYDDSIFDSRQTNVEFEQSNPSSTASNCVMDPCSTGSNVSSTASNYSVRSMDQSN